MSSTTTEASGHKLYSERQEYSDVVPVLQDDGPHGVVPIAYSLECTYQS